MHEDPKDVHLLPRELGADDELDRCPTSALRMSPRARRPGPCYAGGAVEAPRTCGSPCRSP
eukprot:4809344-Pyramimonas_sp.AAC.1